MNRPIAGIMGDIQQQQNFGNNMRRGIGLPQQQTRPMGSPWQQSSPQQMQRPQPSFMNNAQRFISNPGVQNAVGGAMGNMMGMGNMPSIIMNMINSRLHQ